MLSEGCARLPATHLNERPCKAIKAEGARVAAIRNELESPLISKEVAIARKLRQRVDRNATGAFGNW